MSHAKHNDKLTVIRAVIPQLEQQHRDLQKIISTFPVNNKFKYNLRLNREMDSLISFIKSLERDIKEI